MLIFFCVFGLFFDVLIFNVWFLIATEFSILIFIQV